MGIPEGTPSTVARQYLGLGESAFKWVCATSLTSSWFDKESGTRPMDKP